jgi:hypothetical protein
MRWRGSGRAHRGDAARDLPTRGEMSPAVENGDEADLGAEMPGVGGDGLERLGVRTFLRTNGSQALTLELIALWKPSPRRATGVPYRIQNLWWQKVGLRRSSFMETRSPEIVITPGVPRFDFQAATRWLNTNDIEPSIERTSAFLDGIGLKY